MQIFYATRTNYPQSIHYENDLYDLDIELKAANSSINPHENANLDDTMGLCTPGCQNTWAGCRV